MKDWILQTFFSKELAEAERQGGIKAFPLASKDVLETMRDDLDDQADLLAVQKLQNMLTGVDLTRVVTMTRTGLIYIGGEKADEIRLQNLRAEAEALVQMEIWKLIHETPRELAQKQMFVSSETLDDVKKGKAVLFLLSQQDNIVEILRNVKK